MAAALKLFVNLSTKKLQRSQTNGGPYTLPLFYQGDTVRLEIALVEPGDDLNEFSVVDISGMVLKAAIGDTPTGAAGGPTPFTTQFSFDKVNGKFVGNLPLNTAELNTFLGSLSTKPATFELEITEGSAVTTILQETVTIKAELIETSTLAVAAGETPLSLEMAMGLFVQFINKAGATITFKSPDGTKQRIIGVNNDATGLDSIVQ